MSIVPQDPSGKLDPRQPTVIGVARMMIDSPDLFTREVGSLVHFIGEQHEPPVTCDYCGDERNSDPCPVQDTAISVVIAWLFKVVEERG